MRFLSRHSLTLVPLGAFAVAALLTVLMYRSLAMREGELVQELVSERVNKMSLLVNAQTTGVLRVLERMGHRWNASGGTPEPLWRADVADCVREIEGLRAVEWVDSTYHVRWVEPLAGNEKVLGLDVRFDQQRQEALRDVTARRTISVTPAIDLVQGYRGMLVYYPLYRQGRFDGLLTGVFDVDALFSGLTTRELADDFQLTISNGRTPLFAHLLRGEPLAHWLATSAVTRVYDQSWHLSLVPTIAFAERHRTWMPAATLAGGLFISVMLGLVTRNALLRARQSKILLEANALNDAIMRGTANLIIATDTDGTVVQVNRTFERAMGYTAVEVVGLHTPALWHDPAELSARCAELSTELGRPIGSGFPTLISKAIRSELDVREWSFVRKDGTSFPVRLTVTVLRWTDGSVRGYLCTAEDITEHNALARERHLAAERIRLSEERHRLLLEGVEHYAIYWLDPQGNVNSWNSGARSLKQYTEEEIVGRHYSIFFTETDRQRGLPEHALQQAAASGRYASEGWRVRKDGSRFWASVHLQPIRSADGAIAGFAKISHDETARREMDRRLFESIQELNAVLATMVDGLITTEEDGKIITLTKMAERILGYRESELVGRQIESIVPLTDLSCRLDSSACSWEETGTIIDSSRETTASCKDGREVPVELGLSAYEIAGRKRLVWVIRDITERVAAERALKTSEETFRSAMESASIGIALVRPNGRFMKVNGSLCTLLGYTERELLQTDFQAISHPEDLERDLDFVRQALAGQINHYRMEKRYFHKDGHVIWIQLGVALVRDALGSPSYFVSQIQDITEEKEIDRLKSEFISVVSHELRTPLTSIRGSLGLILGTSAGQLPEKVRTLLEIGQTNCERLILLINDILDIDKIASGRMRFDVSEVALAPVVEHAVTAMEAYAEKFGVRIELAASPESLRVAVDEERFIQVMTNLLSNAVKFSPRGESVRVTVRSDGLHVRVSVIDCGCGIPTEFRGRIFEKFSQADSSAARRAGGTGLGLHITRQIVERMSGRIDFDSTPGKGSTFWVDLPLVVDPAETLPLGATADLPGNCLPKILHVEDDPDLVNVIATALNERAEVILAPSLSQARSALRRHSFALVILDLKLADGSGIDLLDDIETLVPAPPVVILCADAPAPSVAERVRSVMVKTRISEARIVESILGQLQQTVDTGRMQPTSSPNGRRPDASEDAELPRASGI